MKYRTKTYEFDRPEQAQAFEAAMRKAGCGIDHSCCDRCVVAVGPEHVIARAAEALNRARRKRLT